MKDIIKQLFFTIDWVLLGAVLLISGFGLVTMNSFVGENNFFVQQIVWISISVAVFFVLSFLDFRFLRRTNVIITLFLVSCALLVAVLLVGETVQGAQRWLNLGVIMFQPSDPIKLVLILILAKYFARRHVEIANVRHVLISGAYAFVLFLLVFLQPDLGTSLILFTIWGGIVLVSGMPKKQLALFSLLGVIVFVGVWFSPLLQDYQKERVASFIYPRNDLQGAGYHSTQSRIAVGSGQVLGKGIGYGTQSKLEFLPEYETDFIFAAFSEEWGFIGVLILFFLFGVVLWRILVNAFQGATNFETLFALGLAIFLMTHFVIHVSVNIGLLPVTGTTLPFMSYGGSHLLTEFVGLGILMGMRRYRHTTPERIINTELIE